MTRSLTRDLKRLPVVIAVLVLCATTLFQLFVLKPAEARLAAVQQTLARSVASDSAVIARVSLQNDPGGKLGQFYEFFAGAESYVDWLARFHAVAMSVGLEPQRVEYRRIEPAGVPMVVYEISVPLNGEYSRIRALSHGVLKSIRVASLDQITFKRQDVSKADVEAELRFSLYLPKK